MSIELHNSSVKALAQKVKQFNESGTKIRIFHGGTNSTRKINLDPTKTIDTSHLNRVIEINTKEHYALVEPNVSMRQLVDATLNHLLIPPVVMEFPEITVGGGIQGGAGESSSFKWGLFHEICELYEMILGNGEVIEVSPSKNADLFYNTACSYGTLGILTLIKIRLMPAKPFVHLKYRGIQTVDLNRYIKEAQNTCADFFDAILFTKEQGVAMTGYLSDKKDLPQSNFSDVSDNWFYIHAEKQRKNTFVEEIIPLKDYLFRYDRSAFWAGKYVFEYFHLPLFQWLRKIMNPVLTTKRLYKALHVMNISHDYIIQDITVPQSKLPSFLDAIHSMLKIYPLWICPLKTSHLTLLAPNNVADELGINVGIWGSTARTDFSVNRSLEHIVQKHGGRKVLYAHAYYPQEEFWTLYDQEVYQLLRNKYAAERVFLDVYEKIVVTEKYEAHILKGFMQIFKEKFKL